MFKSTKSMLAAAALTGLAASVALPLVTHAQGWGQPAGGPLPVVDAPLPPTALIGPAGDQEIAMGGQMGGPGMGGSGMMGGMHHIDGRIAFLKAELKITPAQEASWNKVAAAMRGSAAEFAKLHDGMAAHKDENGKDQPQSALQRIDWRVSMAEAHAKSIVAFASAFKPLYDQLSDDQRKAADALFAPHHFRHG